MSISPISSEFSIHSATPEEYHSIVTEPNIINPIKEANQGLTPDYEDNSYIIKYREYRLLFTIFEKHPGVYEIHIACPRNSIIASRALALAIMTWVESKYSNTKAIITNCPEGKIANMVRKLGFIQIDKEEDKLHFIYVY